MRGGILLLRSLRRFAVASDATFEIGERFGAARVDRRSSGIIRPGTNSTSSPWSTRASCRPSRM